MVMMMVVGMVVLMIDYDVDEDEVMMMVVGMVVEMVIISAD
ncbi:hypothetical protein A2U01_0108024, partial [Trifolium medium]|nr:hypothetical protein [Trifolium medium]